MRCHDHWHILYIEDWSCLKIVVGSIWSILSAWISQLSMNFLLLIFCLLFLQVMENHENWYYFMWGPFSVKNTGFGPCLNKKLTFRYTSHHIGYVIRSWKIMKVMAFEDALSRPGQVVDFTKKKRPRLWKSHGISFVGPNI